MPEESDRPITICAGTQQCLKPGAIGLNEMKPTERPPASPPTAGRLHVRRTKRGTPSVHPIQGDELRALRRLQREQPPSPYVHCSERGGPIAAKSFHTLIWRLGERAGIASFPIHPHMLRHGCGYALANAGHDTRAIGAWNGPAPLIATALLAWTGSGYAIAVYIAVTAIISIIATLLMPDHTNKDISHGHV